MIQAVRRNPLMMAFSNVVSHGGEIDVYRITCDGSSFYERNLGVAMDMIKDSDYNQPYTITKIRMDKAKYESMAEFKGF